ncbi:hypothetical protein M9458_021822, partial [Cirrhinus mrigala]
LLCLLVLSLLYLLHHWGVWGEHLSASVGHIRPSSHGCVWNWSMRSACWSGNEGGSSLQISNW